MNLLPRNEKFFDLFQQHMRIVCQSSELLLSGLKGGYSGVCRISKQMEALERSGDEVIHQLFRTLQTTFITPFDPEDIQTLATTLDNVLDYIEDATFRISCYRVDPVPEPAVQLAQMIADSTKALARALTALEQRKPVWDDCIEVNRLENEADAVERTVLGDLFTNGTDPVTLIKLKEVYEILEQATDLCEDVADVIQNVAVKNS
jgi:predicted phosphate transport protein (TIGR00153 family)